MRIPNLVELGRSPKPFRYAWVLVGDTVRAGTTWIGLNRSAHSKPTDKCLVLDLEDGRIFQVDVREFLTQWRPHYFSEKWVFKAPEHKFRGFKEKKVIDKGH